MQKLTVFLNTTHNGKSNLKILMYSSIKCGLFGVKFYGKLQNIAERN